ncbi:hypothetical protein BH23CHL10_BH23CHL10_12560 [soil metagenome]
MGWRPPGQLPVRQRIIGAVAVPVLVFLALVLLAQGGVLGWSPLPVDWLAAAMVTAYVSAISVLVRRELNTSGAHHEVSAGMLFVSWL